MSDKESIIIGLRFRCGDLNYEDMVFGMLGQLFDHKLASRKLENAYRDIIPLTDSVALGFWIDHLKPYLYGLAPNGYYFNYGPLNYATYEKT